MVFKFFEFYADWKWPSSVGIHSGDLDLASLKQFDDNVSVTDLMPVIIPSYEGKVSTYRITTSTFNLITKEIRAGKEKCIQA
jgi:poly(A) polymerase Pap1